MKAISILGLVCLLSVANSQTDTLTIFDFEDPSSAYTITVFGNYYLDGETVETIANPLATSVNGSKSVIKYTKALNANWKAGFSVDLTEKYIPVSSYEVCFDYMADRSGTCYLELESNKKPDYFLQAREQYTEVGQWQTICQKLKLPENGPKVSGAANIQQLNFYPDYNEWGDGEERSYYLDNIRLCYNTGEKLVTFSVDMDTYFDEFDQVYVSGNFNGWSGNAHPLTDVDGDGVWETTLLLWEDYIEYVFTIDGWNSFEKFSEEWPCISSTPDGNGGFYRNRFAELSTYTTLSVSCFGSCEACSETARITWNLNMNEEEVSEEGVFLAGGAFGHGEYEMLDDDGDGIYSITIKKIHGFQSHYTFINGLCPSGWWCKEDLTGQACGDEENYYDRFLPPVYGHREIDLCFGYCSSKGFCEEEILYQVTYNFDTRDPYYSGVIGVAGNSLNSWNYTNHLLTDSDGDGIFTITTALPPGEHEYKFVVDGEWEGLNPNDDCTITDPSGVYTNRYFVVEDHDLVLEPVEYELCAGFSSLDELSFGKIKVYPTHAENFLYIDLEKQTLSTEVSLQVVDGRGACVIDQVVDTRRAKSINVQELVQGLYFINVYDTGIIYTARFIKV